jgi:DNA recombination protein RmuC
MGKALETAVGGYNKFVGSLETQVLTQARRFEELQADHEGRTVVELAPVETAIRPLARLTSDSAADPPALTLVEAAPTSAP